MNEPSMINPQGSDARALVQANERMPDVYQASAVYSDPLFDFATIRGLVHRQFYLMVSTFIAVVLLGGIITVLQKPLYTASATVRLEPNGNLAIASMGLSAGISGSQLRGYIATLGEVVKSRSMAETVAEDLKLADRPDFLGEQVEDNRPPGVSDEQWRQTKKGIAAAQLQSGFQADVPTGDAIMTLRFTSGSPALAAEIANGYAKAFSTLDTRDEIEQNQYAKEFLEKEIEVTREKLREAERAANLYARNAELISASAVDLDSGAIATVTGANLASINSTFAQVRADRIKAEQRWRAVENIPASQLPEVQNNANVQSLLNQRLGLQGELDRLLERYNEQFPEVVDVRRKLEQIDAQIEDIAQGVKSGIRNDFVVAQRQEVALRGELDQVTSSALDEQDRQVQLDVLKRESQAAKLMLDALLTQYNAISAAAKVDRGTIKMIDAALVPRTPSSPNHLRNMLLAVFAGIGLAGGLAFIREFADDRIRAISTIEERVGLPVLGHTPSINADDLDSAGSNQFSELMEAYASIKSTVEFSIPREKNVIQITSSQSGEGKSTTALILAELFARLGRRTLLIDADMRRPSIGALIEEPRSEMGFAEVLLGHAEMNDVLVKNVHENLDILPMGNIPSNPIEALSSPQFRRFVETQRREYSMVVFDSPPVIGLADSPLISQRVDASVFVVEANKVRLGQAKAAVKRLQANGANLIGAVLTKFVPEKAGENYNYDYDYYSYGKD